MKLEEIIRAGLPASIRCGSFGPRSIHFLVGLTTPVAFIFAAIVGDQMIRLALLCFAAIPVLVTLVVYVILCFVTRIACSRRNIGSGSGRWRSFTKRVGIPKLWMLRTRLFELKPRTLGPAVERTNENSSSGV